MASEDEINIVIERLRVMPRDIKLNLGQYGPLDRDQLITAVTKQDEIGAQVVRMQMSYLRSFKERVKA